MHDASYQKKSLYGSVPLCMLFFVFVCVVLPRVGVWVEEGVEDSAQLPTVARTLSLPRQTLHLP